MTVLEALRNQIASQLARDMDAMLMACSTKVLGRSVSLEELSGRLFVARYEAHPGWEHWSIRDDHGVIRLLARVGPIEMKDGGQKVTFSRKFLTCLGDEPSRPTTAAPPDSLPEGSRSA